MFTAASLPMWVAMASLGGVILTPIIQGRVTRNSPLTKADAAEKFTRMAEGVVDDYQAVSKELREIKLILQALVRSLDRVTCNRDDPEVIQLREQVELARERMY